MEEALEEQWLNTDANVYGLTREEFVEMGFEFAEWHGIRSSLNKEKKLEGKDWVGV